MKKAKLLSLVASAALIAGVTAAVPAHAAGIEMTRVETLSPST